jgi:hypothetical protein
MLQPGLVDALRINQALFLVVLTLFFLAIFLTIF